MARLARSADTSIPRWGLAIALWAGLSAGAALAGGAQDAAAATGSDDSRDGLPVEAEAGGGEMTSDPEGDVPPAPVDAERFGIVKDDTLGVRPEEGALYEAVLDELRAADPATLAAEADRFRAERREALNLSDKHDFPVFPDLFNHPELYRGQAVTMIGQARKITQYPAGPSAADPEEQRVSVVLYTDDAQTNPAVVIALNAPGLPRGDDLLEPVKVTGRFFKRWGYEAQDGKLRIAPLILADRIESVKVAAPPPAAPFVLGLIVAVSVVGLSAGLWAWWLRPKRRKGTVAAGGGETPDLVGFTPPADDEPEFPRGE
ncbi:hypothetical protein [Alienimonas chondri]|uniref:Secreted protein n=1 Tax=Alienimonas chondri TaxID=2681879 RepID=A0ABX1VKC6_9PLAN|nr:hypothetical protein [Alienimonas chondri]NNJ27602.1 hypothetical protein [Alienimonas chondri]